MSTLYRSPRTRRKTNSHTLPVFAVIVTILVLLAGLGYMFKNKIIAMMEPPAPIIEYSDAEANDKLETLLSDLSGDRIKLLELAKDFRTRIGWIKNPVTRKRFSWILMERLIEQGEWNEAKSIITEVQDIATMEQLDRIASTALKNNDLELQMELDRRLLALSLNSPEKTELLLGGIRRTVASSIRLQREDEAVKAVARLDIPAVLARLTKPEEAAEAAELMMMRAKVSEVKAPVLQKIRNILQQAKWPACPATAYLIMEEVSQTLRDSSNLSTATLREVEEKLERSRDALFAMADVDHQLPICYTTLGELRYRMGDYEACANDLSLAAAFAEGYGEMTPELRVRLARVRSRALEAKGDLEAALVECRYLADHDSDASERLRCLILLAAQAQDEEKVKRLTDCWSLLSEDAELARANSENRLRIAKELSAYYAQKDDATNAARWMRAMLSLVQESNPDLTDGKVLETRYELGLVQRKAKNDDAAIVHFRNAATAIEEMSEAQRASLDSRDAELYKKIVREWARTHVLKNETRRAREIMRKIGATSLPDKVR